MRGFRNADLRLMPGETHDAFQDIVRDGLMRALGMESFADRLSEEDSELIRQYIISRATLDRTTALDPEEATRLQ